MSVSSEAGPSKVPATGSSSAITPEYRIGSRLVQIHTVTSANPSRRHAPTLPSVRYGTLRYVGPIDGQTGSWLGVEWDDELKGKHDGSHKGKRYFSCYAGRKAGSFLKMPSATDSSLVIGGQTFLTSLTERYLGGDKTIIENASSQTKSYSRRNLADIDIEMPNINKIRDKAQQVRKLKVVSLTGPMESHSETSSSYVSRASPEDADDGVEFRDPKIVRAQLEEDIKSLVGKAISSRLEAEQESSLIGETIPMVHHLDLSQTLLSSWTDVALITRHLPSLRVLHLNHNRLPQPTSADDPELDCVNEALQSSQGLKQVRSLGLDRTQIDWPHFTGLAIYTPALECVSLADNGLTSLGSSGINDERLTFAHVREVNLARNKLNNWTDVVSSLAALPALERLFLSGNELAWIATSIALPGTDHYTLANLKHISLTGNPLLRLPEDPVRLQSHMSNIWTSLYALDRSVAGSAYPEKGLQSLAALPRLGGDDTNNEKMSAEEASLTATVLPPKSSSEKEISSWALNVIARLPSLMTLNGSAILPMQRRDAELWFLTQMDKRLQDTMPKNGSDVQSKAVLHQLEEMEIRWRPLREAYGMPDPISQLSTAKKATHSIKGRMIHLDLHLCSSSVPAVSGPSSHLEARHTVVGFALLPTTSLKNARAKCFKALGLSLAEINRAKVQWKQTSEDEDSRGQFERWFGSTSPPSDSSGQGAQKEIVFEIDDELKSLDAWGLGSTQIQEQMAQGEGERVRDGLWVCFPKDVLDRLKL